MKTRLGFSIIITAITATLFSTTLWGLNSIALPDHQYTSIPLHEYCDTKTFLSLPKKLQTALIEFNSTHQTPLHSLFENSLWCDLNISNTNNNQRQHLEILVNQKGSLKDFSVFTFDSTTRKIDKLKKDSSGNSYLIPHSSQLFRVSINPKESKSVLFKHSTYQNAPTIELYTSSNLFRFIMDSLFFSGTIAALCITSLILSIQLARKGTASHHFGIILIINFLLYPIPKPAFMTIPNPTSIVIHATLISFILFNLIHNEIQNKLSKLLYITLLSLLLVLTFLLPHNTTWFLAYSLVAGIIALEITKHQLSLSKLHQPLTIILFNSIIILYEATPGLTSLFAYISLILQTLFICRHWLQQGKKELQAKKMAP